ncbi:MAG: hypothetical protein DRH03_05290 [Deltaproteobacteria bacterium]|nr:MAG: hypothetical protein DRH03_05290 [Deltaproteobacteria bacterium]
MLFVLDARQPNQARAWELVCGRISTMAEVNGKIHLTVITDSKAAQSQESTSAKISQTTIDLEVLRQELPPRLKEGDLIRIWKQNDNPSKTVRISYGRGYDPTGVRSRLSGRGRRSGGGGGRGGGKGGGGHGGH